MGANFRPNMSVISNMKPFRFWCQKVLPTVYDDSLSYYELLNKVVIYLNETVDNVELLNTNVNGLYDAYVALEGYVNTYFDDTLPTLVEEKLDEMAEDGTLTALIGGYADAYFETKSEEIDASIAEQNEDINLLEQRMTAFITNHSGLNGETVLADLSASADRWYTVDSTVTLNDDPSNYKYIDFYVCNRERNLSVQRFTIETVLNFAYGFYITQVVDTQFGFEGQSRTTSFSMHVGLNSENNNRVLKIRDSKTFVTTYTSDDNTVDVGRGYSNIVESDAIYIYKIVGVKDVADSEVVDARVGYNGTIYQTLGDAIRSQINSLINVITGEITYGSTTNSVTLDTPITSSQIRTMVLANKIPSLLLRDVNDTIRNFNFSYLHEVAVGGQEPSFLVDFVFSERVEGRDTDYIVRIDKNGRVTWETRNY